MSKRRESFSDSLLLFGDAARGSECLQLPSQREFIRTKFPEDLRLEQVAAWLDTSASIDIDLVLRQVRSLTPQTLRDIRPVVAPTRVKRGR